MKKGKLIILIGLIFTMLFGNVFTVSAEENKENVNDTEDYFYTGEIPKDESGNYVYFFYGRASKSNNWYRFQIKSEKKIAMYSEFVEDYIGKTVTVERFWLCGYSFSFGDYIDKWQADSKLTHADYYDFVYYDADSDKYLNDDPFSTRVPPYKVYSDSYAIEKGYFDFFTTTAPIFMDSEKAMNYLKNGDDSGIINKEPVIDEQLYLKNIRWKTEALTGSGGKEDCYCFMSWDTNNLLSGDTVDIRIESWYQHYILGKKVSGIYDVITNKSVDDFSSTSWSHAYSYGLDLSKGSFYFDYLTFPMLYANSIDSNIKNIYNGGINSMYLRLNRFDSKTGIKKQGLWVKVNFKESSVSYPDIDSIQAGTIDEETGIFTPNNNTDYGENGYGINGETGNIVPPNGGGDFGDIDSIDELGEYLFNSLKKLFASLGQFPSFLSSVFSFIPLPIIALIGGSIVVVIILRILGR